jgi:hypothetical protein
METHPQDSQPLADWFNPLASWETASRWNRATFDWMATGWQQWLALVTTVPPQFVAPPTRESSEPAAARASVAVAAIPVRAMARAEPKRTPRTPPKARKTAAKKPRSRRS